jgi:hypothetical protein
MKQLDLDAVRRFKSACDSAADILSAAADSIGGTTVADGFWRFFGREEPPPGIQQWNSASLWKAVWGSRAEGISSIGEDLFGNQLICSSGQSELLIWDHETGEVSSTLLTPDSTLESVVAHGVDWIDFYANGAPQIARQFAGRVAPTAHIHWTTPLALGGKVAVENTSIIDRVAHMVGHGKLWQQISDLSPGDRVIVKSG